MNWGRAIIVCFVVFAGFIGTMVYKMANTQVDLVNKDYYQQAIAYQQQITKRQNSSTLNTRNTMTYSPENQTISIGFPTAVTKGEVTFFRPSDKRLDFTIPFLKTAILTHSTAKMAKGKWKIQATWSDGIRAYYVENDLEIQ
jgi:nitrogen fixation protein FixH